MTWVTVEDTSVVVDTQEVGWKLRYSSQSMTNDDFQVAAAIAGFYAHLTDPMVEPEDAHAALDRARAGTKVVLNEIQQGLHDAVAHEWVIEIVDTQSSSDDQEYSYLLGPFPRSEAEQRAEQERDRNPSVQVALRKTMK